MPNTDTHTAEPNAADAQPLVFSFSRSKEQGVHSLININRVAMGAALIGTGANLQDGLIHDNKYRTAASLLGLYTNIMEMIFSSTRSPTLGELTLAHGAWEHHDGAMHSSFHGKLPEQARDEIEKLMKDAALPDNSVRIGHDKKTNATHITVSDAVFPQLQHHLHDKLELRKAAIGVLQNPERCEKGFDAKGKPVFTCVSLDGVSEPIASTLHNMLKHDFGIHSHIEFEGDHHQLRIPPEEQSKFSALLTSQHLGHGEHIRVGNGHEGTYAPGFIETLTRPDKHPKQHGLLLGAILSNALRIGAGFQEEKLKSGKMERSPLESYSSIWSMMTYLIDYMPEPKAPEAQVVAGVQTHYGTLEGAVHKLKETLDERPLLASAVIKVPTVWMRVQNAWSKEGEDAKKLGAAMDAVRALLTTFVQKDDYGR